MWLVFGTLTTPASSLICKLGRAFVTRHSVIFFVKWLALTVVFVIAHEYTERPYVVLGVIWSAYLLALFATTVFRFDATHVNISTERVFTIIGITMNVILIIIATSISILVDIN